MSLFKVCFAIEAKMVSFSILPCALCTPALYCVESSKLFFNFLGGKGSHLHSTFVFLSVF